MGTPHNNGMSQKEMLLLVLEGQDKINERIDSLHEKVNTKMSRQEYTQTFPIKRHRFSSCGPRGKTSFVGVRFRVAFFGVRRENIACHLDPLQST